MKPMDAMDRYEAGLEVRREVLGPEYVDQGLRRASDFSPYHLVIPALFR